MTRTTTPPNPTPPAVGAEDLRLRRELTLAALARLPGGPGALLLVGAPEQRRSGDNTWRYRPASDLWYLSGWPDPEAALLLRPGAELPFVLFVQPAEPTRVAWEGRRPGPEGARRRTGADAAFPFHELDLRLPELLQGHPTLVYGFGEDAELDGRVFAAMRSAARRGARNGAPGPTRVQRPDELLGELRLRKTPVERAMLEQAAAISVEAHLAAMALGRPGVGEHEVEAEIDAIFRRRGGRGPGYTSIVAGGANACVLHYTENDAPLRDGELCLVDAGCDWGGYTADLTRTWPVGGRFEGARRDVYTLVLAAERAAIAAARPGAAFGAVHDAASHVLVEGMIELGLLEGDLEELLWERRHERWYMHPTSHWLGLDVHDAGAYHLDGASRRLEPGMVLTVEPGLYLPPDDPLVPEALRGIGVRIEDDLWIGPEGAEVLTAGCPTAPDEVEAACGGGAAGRAGRR